MPGTDVSLAWGPKYTHSLPPVFSKYPAVLRHEKPYGFAYLTSLFLYPGRGIISIYYFLCGYDDAQIVLSK